MPKSMLRTCAIAGGIAFTALASYVRPAGSGLGLESTEANAQVNCATASAVSKASVYVLANTQVGVTSTVKLRINGGDGTISIPIAAGLTGAFSDTTHSDSLADGDEYCWGVALSGTGAGTTTISDICAAFTPSSGTTTQWVSGTNSLTSGASTTLYTSLGGTRGQVNTEARSQSQIDVAGTARDMGVYVSANTNTNTMTVRLRINGGNGAQNIPVAAGVTGQLLDTTNSDSLVAGDDVNYSVTTGAGTVIATIESIWLTFDATSGNKTNVFGGQTNGLTFTGGATSYAAYTGSIGMASAAEWLAPVQWAHKLSGMQVRLSANSHASTVTVDSWISGAQGTQQIPIGAGTTGLFTDTTHTDTVAAGGTSMMRVTGGTSGTSTWTTAGMIHEEVTSRPRAFALVF